MKYDFIHIPKTGGTSIKRFIKEISIDNYIHNYEETTKENNYKIHHSFRCKDVNNPIVVIREPMSRFYSVFGQWKKNLTKNYSNKVDCYSEYNTTDISNNALDIYNHTNLKNVSEFINILRNGNIDISDNLFWDVHLKPQSYWLEDCDFKKITVINYNNDILKSLVNVLDIKVKPYKTIKSNTNPNHQLEILSIEDRKFLEEYYAEDYILYKKIHEEPHLFKAVYK